MAGDSPRPRRGEIYLELTFVAGYARMAAIDADTGTEVFVLGPIRTPRAELEGLAIRKLKRKLAEAKDTRPVKPPPRGRFA